MKLLSAEEFIQKHISPQKSLSEIREEFRIECQVMECYKSHILKESDKGFNKVIGKVNILVNACLKKDQERIDAWLAEFSQINNDDTIVVNAIKMITDGKE